MPWRIHRPYRRSKSRQCVHCVAITALPVLLVATQRRCRSRNSRQESSGRLCGVISIVRQCAALA
ncbi:hypothetical protein XcmpCFBP7700_12010 [Xanthomonas campestris]|nr:hypothetical protein XcmpCFBP7700_12010 [Xanthomonas campestris]